jgi:chitodextrinase
LSEPAIKRLGTFLADLTEDKPPDQIHQEILDRLRDPEHELDHRLAGIYLLVKDFVPIWTAIRNGVSLPASSWETVVLPVVVHFSPPHHLKSYLESATSLFLTARGDREIEADPVPGPVFEPEPEPEPFSLLDSVFDDDLDDRPPHVPVAVAAATSRTRTGRRWVPRAAAVAVVAVAAVLIWTGGGKLGLGGIIFSALPERPVVTVPSATPSASPSPDPQPSASPTPAPGRTTAGPGAPPTPPEVPRAPGAPTGLAAGAVTRTSVTLTWSAPADAANVAHYKIFQNNVAYPPIANTTENVIELQPRTTYVFIVRAYNKAGQESPPSNSVTVTTNNPMETTFVVPASVTFGLPFDVTGTAWPCPEVRINIAGRAVKVAAVDGSGGFTAKIEINEQGYLNPVGGGEPMQLVQGKWTITASCAGPGGPTLTESVWVVGDDPMSDPSQAPVKTV